jgi:hypothetical protein
VEKHLARAVKENWLIHLTHGGNGRKGQYQACIPAQSCPSPAADNSAMAQTSQPPPGAASSPAAASDNHAILEDARTSGPEPYSPSPLADNFETIQHLQSAAPGTGSPPLMEDNPADVVVALPPSTTGVDVELPGTSYGQGTLGCPPSDGGINKKGASNGEHVALRDPIETRAVTEAANDGQQARRSWQQTPAPPPGHPISGAWRFAESCG